jgi:hypothetical protein
MRKPRKLVWRLFFSYIFIALGALAAAGWYFTHSLDAFEKRPRSSWTRPHG